MQTIELTTVLNAPYTKVWEEVRQPRLLQYVAKGMISFRPVDPPTFPKVWESREYKTQMVWKDTVPLGWQVIGIEYPKADDSIYYLRDNGRGWSIKTWDHLIIVEKAGKATSYTDKVTIEAGIMTSVVGAFAHQFYRYRQQRWHRLVANNFNYEVG